MRPKLKLISIRLHPSILAMADHFAALKNAKPEADQIGDPNYLDTRSTILRKAIALGLPLVINPPQHQTEGTSKCRIGATSRQKTTTDQDTGSSEHRQPNLLSGMSSTNASPVARRTS